MDSEIRHTYVKEERISILSVWAYTHKAVTVKIDGNSGPETYESKESLLWQGAEAAQHLGRENLDLVNLLCPPFMAGSLWNSTLLEGKPCFGKSRGGLGTSTFVKDEPRCDQRGIEQGCPTAGGRH